MFDKPDYELIIKKFICVNPCSSVAKKLIAEGN